MKLIDLLESLSENNGLGNVLSLNSNEIFNISKAMGGLNNLDEFKNSSDVYLIETPFLEDENGDVVELFSFDLREVLEFRKKCYIFSILCSDRINDNGSIEKSFLIRGVFEEIIKKDPSTGHRNGKIINELGKLNVDKDNMKQFLVHYLVFGQPIKNLSNEDDMNKTLPVVFEKKYFPMIFKEDFEAFFLDKEIREETLREFDEYIKNNLMDKYKI